MKAPSEIFGLRWRFAAIGLLLLLSACAASQPPASRPAPSLPPVTTSLSRMGYATQVGAFSVQENAVRLERLLQSKGIDAYFFRHESGLYKVRFGNHGDYLGARTEAERMRSQGLIEAYFIVAPEDYSAARIQRSGAGDLRAELVRTAQGFLGVPYRWGGEDTDKGFDCSGLTMVSYRLNGLALPRNSRAQFDAGRPVEPARLEPGDLVFFATKGGRRITHVGMYAGGGRFIHAPRPGQKVRMEALSAPHYQETFVGARTYL